MRKKPNQPEPNQPEAGQSAAAVARPRGRFSRPAQVVNRRASSADFRLTAHQLDEESPQHQAELFYLQKQIQTQTPMVLVLEDGERVEGCIEWYDHNAIKVRGRAKTLVYKSAIRYMYKQSEGAQ